DPVAWDNYGENRLCINDGILRVGDTGLRLLSEIKITDTQFIYSYTGLRRNWEFPLVAGSSNSVGIFSEVVNRLSVPNFLKSGLSHPSNRRFPITEGGLGFECHLIREFKDVLSIVLLSLGFLNVGEVSCRDDFLDFTDMLTLLNWGTDV
ncbi:MAG: hypothetical protein ABEI86_04705, partial [Halobacteriaceae archaeon]